MSFINTRLNLNRFLLVKKKSGLFFFYSNFIHLSYTGKSFKIMDNNLKYKSIDYWNERYKDEQHFEWFGDYEKYKSVLNAKLKPSDRILVLGNKIIFN